MTCCTSRRTTDKGRTVSDSIQQRWQDDSRARDAWHRCAGSIVQSRDGGGGEGGAQDFQRRHGARAPATMIDVGCSVGASTHFLRESFPDASILGLDASPYFLAVAQLRERCNLWVPLVVGGGAGPYLGAGRVPTPLSRHIRHPCKRLQQGRSGMRNSRHSGSRNPGWGGSAGSGRRGWRRPAE